MSQIRDESPATLEDAIARLSGANQLVRSLTAELAVERERAERADAAAQNLDTRCAGLEVKTDAAIKTADAAVRRAELAEDGRAALIANSQEAAAWRQRAELAEPRVVELEAPVATLEAEKLEAVLAGAYKAGKLKRGRDSQGAAIASPIESRLRRTAKVDGLAALEAELGEMATVIPSLGRAVLADEDPNPRPSMGPIPPSVLADTARQLDLVPAELEEHATLINGGR
jgi:hypothetical protein